MSLQPRDRQDSAEAARRASDLRADPKIKAWMQRARKLFANQPPGTWIYWQENQLHLMARTPDGSTYKGGKRNEGSDPASSIDSIIVKGSDCGGW